MKKQWMLIVIGGSLIGGPLLSAEESQPRGCQEFVIDFDFAANGDPILPGTIISDQYEDWGVSIHFESNEVESNAGITFDSNNPTGGDQDLGVSTPEEDFGNLLIIAENMDDYDQDGLIDDPDDNASGGLIKFSFTYSTQLMSIDLIDFDNEGSFIEVEGSNSYIEEVLKTDDGGIQSMAFDQFLFASTFSVDLVDSGAIDNLKVCVFKPL